MAGVTRLGVLTGGGDAPGLNAVIRAVVKTASNSGIEVVGLEDSFDGLIEPGHSRVLTPRDVTGILRLGGTILGTTNRGNPFAYPVTTSDGVHDYSDRVVAMFHKMGLDALVVIGGDGTLAIAHQFGNHGVAIVGVPKTIDNSIVVVAEGAFPKGGSLSLIEEAKEGFAERLGGIGVEVCAGLAKATRKETRSVVLGHLQRGGAPTSFDRVLATRFGAKAVELIKQRKFGTMVAWDPPDIISRQLEDIVGKTKTVPMDIDLLLTARALGVTFGD